MELEKGELFFLPIPSLLQEFLFLFASVHCYKYKTSLIQQTTSIKAVSCKFYSCIPIYPDYLFR